jgi:hypothetical protein
MQRKEKGMATFGTTVVSPREVCAGALQTSMPRNQSNQPGVNYYYRLNLRGTKLLEPITL